MILAFKLADLVQVPFGWLLAQLYQFTANYGLALIIFAFIVKLILLPATAKGKKSTMKMSRISPRVQAIQKKYADDQQKQSQEIQKLYKEEGVSMGSGCLWSFLPILILIPLYAVVRQPITYMLQQSAEVADTIVNTVKTAAPELFTIQGDFYNQMIAAPQIPNFLAEIKAAGIELTDAAAQSINFSFFGIDLAAIPTYKVWEWNWANVWPQLGGFLMPILSAAGALVSMLISMRMNNSLVTNEKGIEDKETAQNSQSAQQSKMMMWLSPVMSLWIGFSMPAALSLYWFAQGIVTTLADVYLTNKYRKIYDEEDAERLKKALAEEAVEAEKERVRAERRAANPEGITSNTSKKKIQQNKLREQEEAKAAAAKEYAARKEGVTVEEAPAKQALSGIADRPYCKGRAYDPNRYKNTEE